jgi:integrase
MAVGKMVGKPVGRQINKLSARKVETVDEPGRHSDGGGLYLNVTESGGRSWLFMYKIGGRRREMGLGSLRDVPLIQARKFAANARQQLFSGLDPLTARQKPASMTFAEAASALIESMSPAWRNAKHRAQWKMTLTVYCAPIASKAAADITTDDVLRVLKPLWQTKPETGSRLRGRIERALDFAKARGMRSGENPARWRGHLDALLPKRQKLTRGHHKAMAFDDVPEFIKQLHKMPGVAPAALEFAVLTVARSGEVMGGQWDEIDLTTRVWTVPATRMKGGREHRVPLSDRTVQILKAMQSRRVSKFIFPGSKSAGTDEAGHAFQFEAGRVFRSEAGHPWRQSHGSI